MHRLSFSVLALALAAGLILAIPAAAQEVIPLWPDGPPAENGLTGPETATDHGCVGNVTEATLSVYRPDSSNGAAVLVVPGGGYAVVCRDHEGRAVADWLNGLGYTVGVLTYRMPNGHPDVPIQDAQQALRVMRAASHLWGYESRRVGILGFSAGGHLASTVGTHFDTDYSHGQGMHRETSQRPDFMILVYPVITMDEALTHGGSRRNLLGEEPPAERVEQFSNELRVTARTPPTFLVHSGDDGVVPPANSLRFYESLLQARVSAEMHVFDAGGHGYGLAPDEPWGAWTGLVEAWLGRIQTRD